MGTLKKLKSKIKPTFKSDESGIDESVDGAVHTGSILVRNYINDLDMDFYAGRASMGGKESTEVISLRVPSDLLKDIAIVIESGQSRFRDRSELIRTSTYILLNYIANKLKKGIKDISSFKEMEDYNRYKKQEIERLLKNCDNFRNLFKDVEKHGDLELDEWIKRNVKIAKGENRSFYRKRMLNAFWNVIKENGIDPEQYIDSKELEGE